jgi:hypothetical protein
MMGALRAEISASLESPKQSTSALIAIGDSWRLCDNT